MFKENEGDLVGRDRPDRGIKRMTQPSLIL